MNAEFVRINRGTDIVDQGGEDGPGERVGGWQGAGLRLCAEDQTELTILAGDECALEIGIWLRILDQLRGNFVNGELWGRVADNTLPWAMVFPQSGSTVARHPSQIYQFLLEGLLLFGLLWWYAKTPRKRGSVSGLFLMGYGICRFTAEYFREPDAFLGLLSLGLSMGQWLCVPMVLLGALLYAHAQRRSAEL